MLYLYFYYDFFFKFFFIENIANKMESVLMGIDIQGQLLRLLNQTSGLL